MVGGELGGDGGVRDGRGQVSGDGGRGDRDGRGRRKHVDRKLT